MKHVHAILIKFLMTSALLFLILTLGFGIDFGVMVSISLLLTLFSYAIGDVVILPKSNNLFSTVIDFGFSFIVLWLLLVLFIPNTVPFAQAALFSATGIALGEWFFHKYMGMFVFVGELNETAVAPTEPYLRTEFAEEFDERDVYKDQKDK